MFGFAQVWHLCQEDGKTFEKVILSIHSNGFSISYLPWIWLSYMKHHEHETS
jgi:hypothetical protein